MALKYKESAGICIVYDDMILLAHPVNRKWTDSYTFPKGGIEQGETIIDAAIRETKEEVGITITEDMITSDIRVIEHVNLKGLMFKKVYYYVVYINDLSEIGLKDIRVPKEQLQDEEIDWAGFLTEDESSDKLFWRYENIYSHIKKNEI